MFNGPMQKTRLDPMRLTRDYRQLQRQLAHIGYLSQGSVVARPPHRGPCYQWSRKEKAKTITVALSEAQYQWLKRAIKNQRDLARTLRKLQQLSHQILFKTVPGIVRRKRLSKKVLDVN